MLLFPSSQSDQLTVHVAISILGRPVEEMVPFVSVQEASLVSNGDVLLDLSQVDTDSRPMTFQKIL